MAGEAFNAATPDRKQTDPDGVGAPLGVHVAYPRHVYRLVPEAQDGSLVVAWKAKAPIHNAMMDVGTAADEAVALAEGWSLTPQIEPAADDKPKKDADKKPAADDKPKK